jgi:MoaA/NifB/PqqE/SkfB family radical SAM enzyme
MSLLSFLIKARVGLVMAATNLLGLRRPLTSQILVTKHCNLDCPMCFVYPLDKKEKPTLDQLKYLIRESTRLGAQVIIPFGGEPLLRKDIGDIIREIKRLNRYCILYTNGTLMRERIDDLAGVDQLVVSIDGDETTHDKIRGPGIYRKAIEALELAKSRGHVCRIHTCLIPETVDSLDHMVGLSQKYDVMINYGFCDVTGLTDAAEGMIQLDRDRVIAFLEKYAQKKREGIRIATPLKVIEELIRVMRIWPIDTKVLSKEEAKKSRALKIPACALSFSNMYIDTDGNVYPCLPIWGSDPNAPNAYRDGLKKCWEAYAHLDCHQCGSIFTIEKSLFYSFDITTIIDYLKGYQFLRGPRG